MMIMLEICIVCSFLYYSIDIFCTLIKKYIKNNRSVALFFESILKDKGKGIDSHLKN